MKWLMKHTKFDTYAVKWGRRQALYHHSSGHRSLCRWRRDSSRLLAGSRDVRFIKISDSSEVRAYRWPSDSRKCLLLSASLWLFQMVSHKLWIAITQRAMPRPLDTRLDTWLMRRGHSFYLINYGWCDCLPFTWVLSMISAGQLSWAAWSDTAEKA